MLCVHKKNSDIKIQQQELMSCELSQLTKIQYIHIVQLCQIMINIMLLISSHLITRYKNIFYQTSSLYVSILESGAMDHYLLYNPNKNNILQKGYNPITITLPNSNKLTLTH